MVVCKSCNNKVPMGELKAGDDGKWICNTCYGGKDAKNVLNKASDLKGFDLGKREVRMQGRKELKFFCKLCGYRFIRKGVEVKTPEVCPYCSIIGPYPSFLTAVRTYFLCFNFHTLSY